MKKYKNIITNALLLLVSLFLCALLLEVLSSAFYTKIAPAKGVAALESLVYGKQSFATGNQEDGTPVSEVEALPYYLYRNKAFSKVNDIQQINKAGFRNGEKEFSKKKKGVIRIIAIGGSTTFGWMINDYKKTWPLQLEEILNKSLKGSGKVEVINAGLPGGTSAESLISFILNDKFLKPDLVIFHNGGNDIGPLFYKDYSPDYRNFKSVTGSHELRPGEFKLIENSNFIKLLYAFWLQDVNLSAIRGEPKDTATPKEALTNVKNNSPVGFHRNMETLIQGTFSIGAIPVIFPFHLADKKVFKIVPKQMRYSEKYHEATRIGLNKNKAVLKSLAKKYAAPYFEMNQDLIPAEDFFDHCHLKPEGDKIKAEFIAKNLLPLVKQRLKNN